MSPLRAPNTIALGGGHGNAGEGMYVPLNTMKGKGTIKPGDVLEFYQDALVQKLRVHSTANNPDQAVVALECLFLNKGVDDTYPDGELINAGIMQKGSTFWANLASGQNITASAFMQSNGDGKLKAATAGHETYRALESVNASTGEARIRAEVM